jgi:acyl-coenzyme A thioesterase PaaI-like protein
LTTTYRRPIFTPAVVVCRGRVFKREGRKIYVKGIFEDKDGKVYAEANGMWIMMEKNVGRSNVLSKL